MLASLAVSLVEPVISSVVKVEEELEEQEEDSWKIFFSSTPSFNNINVTNYFNDEPRFNGVQETTYLKKKNESYATNRNDKNSDGIHWCLLFIGRNFAAYFGSFGIEYFPQEVLNKIKDKSITHNIFS